MSQDTIIFFLAAVIAVLSFMVLYQRFVFRKGIQKKIGDMGDTLEQILDEKSDEKVMVFTDDKALIHLSSQINRLLDDRQRIQADFRRSEISAKNMLSNISHDIRTPMTVILGYLEIMRLEAEGKDKMVAKVEQKARKVMELINQFFTLAKLESGDTQVEMGRVNLSECCRENVLDFYELLTQKEFQVEIEIPEEPVFVEDVDVIQVGTRNMQNFELLKELGKLKKPILLKRGMANTLDELLMSAEYIMAGGNENVILCERGIRTFETSMRNTLDISAIPMLKKKTHLPVIIDPSHAAGIRFMVEPLTMAAIAAGADGVMIEVHNNPEKALCDGMQSLTPAMFDDIMQKVKKTTEFFGKVM